jgi:hypothetical protein
VAVVLRLTLGADPVVDSDVDPTPDPALDPAFDVTPDPGFGPAFGPALDPAFDLALDPAAYSAERRGAEPLSAAALSEAEVRGLGRFVTSKVAPLSLALLAAVLLTSKQLPVQASLLLLPLIALSGLRWRDHLIWVSTELVYFVGIWLYIAGETTPSRGLPAVFYLVMLLARLAGIAWVGVQGVLVYRSALLPAGASPPDAPGWDAGCGKPGPETAACGQISSQVADAGRLLDGRNASSPHNAG